MKKSFYIMMGRIKEAIQLSRPSVDIVRSLQCIAVLDFLYTNNFILGYSIVNEDIVTVYFRYVLGVPYILALNLISTPGRMVSLTYRELRKISRDTTNIVILSTKRGLVRSDILLSKDFESLSGEMEKNGGIMLFSVQVRA